MITILLADKSIIISILLFAIKKNIYKGIYNRYRELL